MAGYYSLITRAVAALDKNNGESRRALYEHARTALLTQLRSMEPALYESDITRERLALEESIRKVEAESARKFIETPEFDDRARNAMPFDRPEMLGSRGPKEQSFGSQRDPYVQHGFSEPMLESAFPIEDAEHVPAKARRASPAAEDAPYYQSSAQAQQR